VHRGDLDDLNGLREAAAASDGIIHLAFKHELLRSGDFLAAVAADLDAIVAIGEALEGSDKPFVSTSGTLMLTHAAITGRPGTELDAVAAGPRVDAENTVVALAPRRVRSSVVRLPPLVHSTLDHHGFGPTLIAIARATGVSGYPGEGTNRWPAVHTLDAARVYRLALESALAGSRLHAVAEDGVPFRDIAAVIGRKLGLRTVPVAPEDAEKHFGFLAPFVSRDNPTSSELTRAWLAWEPAHPALLEDLDQAHYFGW
jgi:nucleoside-diphosphate-sugar epimerase